MAVVVGDSDNFTTHNEWILQLKVWPYLVEDTQWYDMPKTV